MNKVSFAMVFHSHQPIGNFDHVIEEAFQKSYLPFVEALLRHPRIRVGLHYSGILLEWLKDHHADFFQQLRELETRKQVELIGGGYYEPILPVIPDADKLAQLRKLASFLQQHLAATPRGAWVAERVWEPGLALPLAEAGVEYVILDDTHFLAAGLEPGQLRGYYITEEQGAALRLVPSLKAFRYSMPFREPEETMRVLREGAGRPDWLFAVGDDCEKFGVWPGTYDHVYKNGWLERFLTALEEAEEWLETTTLSDYLASHPPLARVYLPTASYAEMMEWALPAPVSAEFHAVVEESERAPSVERFRRFLHGGFWRNFLSKYPESNQIHKLMLGLSQRWQESSRNLGSSAKAPRLLAEAQTRLLAAQCNDAYWHGIFGGLYAPHLRSALVRNLIQVETLLDKAEGGKRARRVKRQDFDVDGHEEILVEEAHVGWIVRPADGGTVSSLRYKPADAELLNSLQRRPEAYHALVRQEVTSAETPREGPASIHDRVLSKQSNLDGLLRYDRYARHTFRTYLFPALKSWQDFEHLELEENADLAGGPWAPASVATDKVELKGQARLGLPGEETHLEASKTIASKVSGAVWRIECRSSLSAERPSPAGLALGLELVFNLLAPDSPDRYFLANTVRRPLEFRGDVDAANLRLVDEWQDVQIALDAHPRPRWWIVPIETVSQSEAGFERVYQGSAILVVWKLDPPSWREATCTLSAEISPWKG